MPQILPMLSAPSSEIRRIAVCIFGARPFCPLSTSLHTHPQLCCSHCGFGCGKRACAARLRVSALRALVVSATHGLAGGASADDVLEFAGDSGATGRYFDVVFPHLVAGLADSHPDMRQARADTDPPPPPPLCVAAAGLTWLWRTFVGRGSVLRGPFP